MDLGIFKTIRRALRPTRAEILLLLGSFLLLAPPGPAVAQEVPGGCGSLRRPGQFGPYDYRPDRYIPEPIYRSHKALLRIVESAHFTPEVEALVRGKTGRTAGGDLSYTLRAFPNHHRALLAMAALGEQEKSSRPVASPYSIECWFRRAITWRPDDTIVRMIFAQYLSRNQRKDEAEQQLSVAASQAGDNAFTHHNIGLVYFEMRDYEKALIHAHKAYALGLGIPTLKAQLKSVGKWFDPMENLPVEPAGHPQ